MRRPPTLAAALLLLALSAALAHDDDAPAGTPADSNSLHIKGYHIVFAPPAEKLYVGDALALRISVEDPQGAPATGLKVQGQILDGKAGKEIYFAAITESPPGTYTFSWQPNFAGDYLAQFLVQASGDTLQPTFALRVDDRRALYAWIGGIIAAAVGLALGILSARPHAGKAFRILPLLGGLVLAGAAIGAAFGLSTFYQTGGDRGFVVCTAQGCDLAVHWHSELEMTVCGEPYTLPLEAGDLMRQHTHKEANRLHFHDVIKTNAGGSELLEPEKMRAGALFDQLGLRFSKTCFLERCTGDPCPDGHAGTLSMSVNALPNDQLPDYVWKDGDKIRITFG